MKLSALDRDLLAYYHLRDCAWRRDERRDCSCGLISKVEAIVRAPEYQAAAS